MNELKEVLRGVKGEAAPARDPDAETQTAPALLPTKSTEDNNRVARYEMKLLNNDMREAKAERMQSLLNHLGRNH